MVHMLCTGNRSHEKSDGVGDRDLKQGDDDYDSKINFKNLSSGMDVDCKDFKCTPRSHQGSPTEVVEHLGSHTDPLDGLGPFLNSTGNKPLVEEFLNPKTWNLDTWNKLAWIFYSWQPWYSGTTGLFRSYHRPFQPQVPAAVLSGD